MIVYDSGWLAGMESWLLFCYCRLSSALPMKSVRRTQLTLAAMFLSFPAEESLGMKGLRLWESRLTLKEGRRIFITIWCGCFWNYVSWELRDQQTAETFFFFFFGLDTNIGFLLLAKDLVMP